MAGYTNWIRSSKGITLDCTAMWMLLGNNINRTQQSPVVIYSIPVPPKSSTALSLQTTQTSFDPNYVAVGHRSGQCKIFYILNRGIVSDIVCLSHSRLGPGWCAVHSTLPRLLSARLVHCGLAYRPVRINHKVSLVPRPHSKVGKVASYLPFLHVLTTS